MISKSCKYALRAAIYLASKADGDIKLGVKEIATEIEAPQAFTGKVLQILKKHRIISSLKGPYGGFFFEKHQLDLPIINIV
ncbi:MAG TPA: Rrf2 family transcriptional regulator, partial [Arenibacter sp.]|nr:Rrf2 family transcriptional regulator [Arenibacter sp.]